MIKDYRFGTARTHDSVHIDDLIENETDSVFADSAYMDKKRKEKLEKKSHFLWQLFIARFGAKKKLRQNKKTPTVLVAAFGQGPNIRLRGRKITGY